MKTLASIKAVQRRAVYLSPGAHWRRLRPHFEAPEAKSLWKALFDTAFKPHLKFHPVARRLELPQDYDSSDWQAMWRSEHPGRRMPAWWKFTCCQACHWLAELNLLVVAQAFPEQPWRILTGKAHTTVWNGDRWAPLVFDPTYEAIGLPARDALMEATKHQGRDIRPGHFRKTYIHGIESML